MVARSFSTRSARSALVLLCRRFELSAATTMCAASAVHAREPGQPGWARGGEGEGEGSEAASRCAARAACVERESCDAHW